MASEVTQLYLMDAELYGGASPTTGIREEDAGSQGAPGLATQAIDTLLRGHIFPTIPKLLQDEDPMPLYALKVRTWVLPDLVFPCCCCCWCCSPAPLFSLPAHDATL